jgi:glycosyltransferase involved in cell wall biosynthesis
MRILVVHNEYGAVSGEEVMLNHAVDVLASHGHPIYRYTRSSREIEGQWMGKARAMCNGVYSASARRDIRKILRQFSPDVAIIKNLYPLISPAILPVIAKAGIPVVMLVSNYRLVCPNGLHFAHGKVCERCTGGREYQCVLQNCEENLAKSFGYALRSWVARKAGWYKDHVTRYVCASEFLKQKLTDGGFDPSRITILPNVVPDMLGEQAVTPADTGIYVAYTGRISKEKGIVTLLKAAALCPEIEFKLAGRKNISLNFIESAPANVKFVGHLEGNNLVNFRCGARLVLSTSECYETFGMSVAEAMLCARPVVVSRIGVFPEFVHDGLCGILFEPGNAADLAEKVKYLWHRPDLCNTLGAYGRQQALRDYSEVQYYLGLMGAISAAVQTE